VVSSIRKYVYAFSRSSVLQSCFFKRDLLAHKKYFATPVVVFIVVTFAIIVVVAAAVIVCVETFQFYLRFEKLML
jgi:hypothetical protein